MNPKPVTYLNLEARPYLFGPAPTAHEQAQSVTRGAVDTVVSLVLIGIVLTGYLVLFTP